MFNRKSSHNYNTAGVSCCRKAVALLMLLMPLCAMAQTRTLVTIADSFSVGATYTITAANTNHYQLYYNGSALAGTETHSTDATHQFAFVQDPGDASRVYLYNVGAKKFVYSDGHLGTGSPAPVYVYTPANSNFAAAGYIYVVAFNGNITDWNNQTTTNTTNHVLQLSATPSFQDWSLIGGGGNNSLRIDSVGTFTAADLAAARRRLVALTDFSAKSFGDAGITVNTTAYKLSTNGRSSLYATASGLTRTDKVSPEPAGDDANRQFVFVTDPTDDTKVYLYSVGQERFVAGTSQSTGTQPLTTGSGSAPIYVFGTDDYEYTLAFAFSETAGWSTASSQSGGTTNVNLNGNGVVVNSYSSFDAGNRFTLVEAGEFPAPALAAARTFLSGSYTPADYAAAGLKTDSTVYTLTAENGSLLYAGANGLTGSATATAGDANAQFVVFTDTADTSRKYLYSVGQGRFVTSANGYGTAEPVYAFATNDSHGYSLALGFGGTWTGGAVVSTSGVTTSASPDMSNRFRLTDVTDSAYFSPKWKNDILNNRYTLSSLAEMGLSSDRVYYIYSGSYVVLDGGGASLDRYTQNSGTVNQYLTNQRTHFAFVTDKDGKAYLYNLSSKKAAKANGQMVSGDGIQPVYIYATHDPSFPVAISFSPTVWDADGAVCINPASGATTTVEPSSANRLRLVEVSDDSYSLATARAALRGWLTGPFHYRGASRRSLQNNGMQSVSEVHYYYYVDTKRRQYGLQADSNRHAIDLQLPFQRYLRRNAAGQVVNTYGGQESNGNNYEPKAYIRWYNYNNDRKMPSSRLIPWADADNAKASGNQGYDNTTQRLTNLISMDGDSLGLYFHPTSGVTPNPNAATVGVAYVIPAEADDEDWAGDTIACDVSFYTDYNVPMSGDRTGNYDGASQSLADFRHEPTLSMRYIYHILPAGRIANELRDALTTQTAGMTHTAADKGLLTFGIKDGSATMNMRTDLQDIDFYYFYPVANPERHHVYHVEGDQYGISEGDIPKTGSPRMASSLEYRVYTADRKYWRVFYTGTSRMFSVSLSDSANPLNGSDWKNLDGTPADTVPVIGKGGYCYVVGYAVNGTEKCPFFNARLDITSSYPMSDTQISGGNHANRTTSYLESHFGSPVASFTFDNEHASQTYGSPSADKIPTYDGGRQGEISNSSTDVDTVPSPFATRQYSYLYTTLAKYRENLGYNLYYGSTYSVLHGDYELFKYRKVYDRTHIGDQSRYGYFLYTDASDESRTLGYQDFSGSLCSGSQLILSAWVCNDAGGASDAQPELRFILYGIDKDAQGNVTSSKQLASLCSGNFANNIDQYSRGSSTWYQVFGVVTLPAESGVDNYADFRIVIDNFCDNTNGADYAIDDIKVYQSNSKLTAIQIPAMCGDGDADSVNIRIKGNYSVIQDLAGKSGKIYYRFVRSDGSAVTGHAFYGDGHDGYGVATVPEAYDSTATLPNGERQFDVSTVTGVQEIVLADHSFNLSPDSTYYVSAASDDGSGQPGTWGIPSNICSLYSDNFQLVRQRIYLNGTTSSSAEVSVACDGQDAIAYEPITVAVTAPDKINGGEISLGNVHYDWFRGTLAQYKAAADAAGNTLAGAVDHYRAVYPTGEYSSGNAPATAANGMVYTAADQALIDLYVGKDSLYMPASTSLSSMSMNAGVNNLLAIAVEDTISAGGQTYVLCDDPTALTIRGLRNGPGLNLGMPQISYPAGETYRSVRLGLPQIRRMGATGVLRVPIASRTWKGAVVTDEDLKFVNDIDAAHNTYLYISGTNDPSIDLADTKANKIAEVAGETLAGDDATVGICNIDTTKLHEGYWYEVELRFQRTNVPAEDADITNCPSETFLRLKIVPEYLTWNPTADNSLNSNWNNDQNWTRSTAGELFNTAYKDYRTPTYRFKLYDENGTAAATRMNANVDTLLSGPQPASYVPMYFSKVIIPTLSSKPYPMMGYIRRQSGTGLILQMANGKSHAATTNIQYDMEASPANADSTDYGCVVFDGNLCEQIYFKSDSAGGGQMRNQQYLDYQKAYVEIAQPVNEWGTFTTPMKMTLAGDMYVPKQTALQTTPLFHRVTMDDTDAAVNDRGLPWHDGDGAKYGLFGRPGATMYSRIKMPVYQKLWGNGGDMYTDSLTSYTSYDNPYEMLIYPSVDDGDNMDLHGGETYNSRRNVWSHTFNALGVKTGDGDDDSTPDRMKGRYANGVGIAAKIGDDYATDAGWVSSHRLNEATDTIAWALLRLPKDDEAFSYREYDNGEVSGKAGRLKAYRTDNYRLGIGYNPAEDNIAEQTVSSTELSVQPMSYDYPNDGSKNLKYVLVGNPYTSSISVRRFVEANDGVLEKVTRKVRLSGQQDSTEQEVNRVWVLSHSVIYELDPEKESSVIAPGQAFFVKMAHPGFDDILFTSLMQTDPNLHVTASAKASVFSMAEEAKAYRITRSTDVTNIIEHGIDSRVVCWSPSPGVIAVSGEGVRSASVYSADGRLLRSAAAGGTELRLATGTGLFVVRVAMNGGGTEVRKVVVR